jgi:hypothetical protein
MDEEPPRRLKERTEKHYCVRCLREVEKDEYLENDFLCDECAAVVDKTMKDER